MYRDEEETASLQQLAAVLSRQPSALRLVFGNRSIAGIAVEVHLAALKLTADG
jgi:hypothetical protein